MLEKRVDISSPPGVRNRAIDVVPEVVLSLAKLKRRISMEHFEDGDAECPNICFLTVAVEKDPFGRHVMR